MRQSNKVDGTKIAQAAKDLNVTSVTIRRYIAEFGIETTSDENGIKVLPDQAMEELKEIRRLKEEGLTNPKVLEFLEENRNKPPEKAEAKTKARRKAEPVKAPREEPEEEPEKEEAPAKQEKKKTARRISKPEPEQAEEVAAPPTDEADDDDDDEDGAQSEDGDASGDGKSKHSLTCQTCAKVFEHMNPRLRDCLECYRAKRKERRRGGADRHKNVIQHPIAQQVASKAAQQGTERERVVSAPAAPARERDREPRERDRDRDRDREPREREPAAVAAPAAQVSFAPQPQPRTAVRNYRKAIEETRQITGSLKRRLERPDLPEGERRWLEQIYAYQLILHQGWRHLAEYKAATQAGKGGAHTSLED